MDRLIRSLVMALLALLALAAPLTPAHAQAGGTAAWQPEADDQWLFELRSGQYRVGDGVRGYARGSAVCVDLGDVIRALDLPIRLDTELRRATGWVFSEQQTLTIDRAQSTATVGSRRLPIAADDILDTPEGWCVKPSTLGQWLGVTITADLGNSILRLQSDTPLPFELAAQRRARAGALRPGPAFNLADLPQARRPYAAWQSPSIDVVASSALIRNRAQPVAGRRSPMQDQLQNRYEVFASGEMLHASFDARLSSDAQARPQSLRLRVYRSDPDGRLLGRLRATHVAVGDVATMSSPTAAQPVIGRGAIATNRPLDLPDSFDRTTFRGDLPAGWDAELYRNGQLLAFASPGADGRYEFADVRLQYGMNRFEIVLYGPQGQVRREVRAIPVGTDALPPHKTYFWAGIVQEGHDLVRLRTDHQPYRRSWRYNFGLEQGLDRRTAVSGWINSMLIENRRITIGEGSIRRAIGTTLVEATASVAADGGTAGRVYWVGEIGHGGSFFQLETLNARNGFRSDRIVTGVRALHSAGFDTSLRLGGTLLPFHIEARYRERTDRRDRIEAAARVATGWRRLSLTGQIDWSRNRFSAGDSRGGDDRLALSLLANARVGIVRLRGEVRKSLVGGNDGDRLALVGEWAASDRSEWRGELGYEAAARRGRFGFGYTRHFRALAVTGFGEAASDGSAAAGISLAFGFGPDPRGGRLRFSRERLASQGQALATVFYDENGDGLHGPAEPLARDVVVTAGNAMAQSPTDSSGQTIIDALVPNRPVLIGIDASSLPSPLVRPSLPGVVVTPRAGVATQVWLPLVSTGEIEGTIVRAGGSGIEGVDIELVDAANIVRATTRSDFDGFFLFESVPYGNYTLRVNGLSAAAAGIAAQLPGAQLSQTQPRIRLGTIAVAARSTLAQGAAASPAAGTR